MILEAIKSLYPELRFSINGEVNNEEDYNTKVRWIIGADADHNAIFGTPDITPTWAEVEAEIARLEAEAVANEYLKNREKAMKAQLPETMYLPAILQQATDDVSAGKVLSTELAAVVAIYNQIIIDNPDPNK